MSTSESVRILRISMQRPSHGTIHNHSLKLTLYDILWHILPPCQSVHFYNTDTHFPTIVDKLREDLSLTLQYFYPMAGKLVWLPETDDLEFQCSNEGDGVLFIEAETDVDFDGLVGQKIHNVNVYQKLVPSLDISHLPAPLLSVQVTRFIAGSGICIGVSSHHMAMDGLGFWNFMKSWANISKFGKMLEYPCHDRQLIQDPHGVAKSFMDELRPSLPKVPQLQTGSLESVKRTFSLSATSIRFLKLRATEQISDPSSGHVSTFLAISAHVWVCAVRARCIHEEDKATLIFLADCRSHLNPPIASSYFGNCLIPCFAHAKGCDLLSEHGLGFAVTKMQQAIRASLEDPCKILPAEISRGVMTVSLSPRFKLYDCDFGWGKASRVEMVSTNDEESMVLQGNRDEEGGVQVSVAVAPHHMEEFEKLLFNGLDGI